MPKTVKTPCNVLQDAYYKLLSTHVKKCDSKLKSKNFTSAPKRHTQVKILEKKKALEDRMAIHVPDAEYAQALTLCKWSEFEQFYDK